MHTVASSGPLAGDKVGTTLLQQTEAAREVGSVTGKAVVEEEGREKGRRRNRKVAQDGAGWLR